MNFKITGGKPLSGTVTINRSKNAAVALLCGSLINTGKTTLKNLPQIEEVKRILEVLESIGVQTTWHGNDLEIVPPAKIAWHKLDQEAAMKTRSVILLLGPLVHYFKSFQLPHPGGCKLGARSVRPHLYALEKLGVKIESKSGHYQIQVGKLRPREIVLYETGDTVTENALLAAARIGGTTTIKFASANYMVQDLCHYLETLGVKIEGIGTSNLVVHGLPAIKRDVIFELSEDPIEAMMFIALAATTNSPLTIKRCPIDFLELELLKLEKMGFKYKITKRYLSDNGFAKLVDIETRPSRLKALEEKIHPLPYPGINIDNLPFFVPVATQARGTTLIHDWVYENRAIYYYEMSKLGANVILADPHRVIIEGPTPLRGNEVICPPALRPAVIILIGMLAARGESILRNVYSINRGYENLVERLNKLGAEIKEIE